MDIDMILEKLKNQLDSKRYSHSVSVMKTAEDLARHYGADLHKARLAGILHDCGKCIQGSEARAFVQRINYKPDIIEWEQPGLLHGVIGEYLARTEYKISEEEVLGAIRWHTTGRAGMTLLEKIIYVADYIEPLRVIEDVDEMRKAAFTDLNQCILLCSDSTIRYILKNGYVLHVNTIETRNDAIMLKRP